MGANFPGREPTTTPPQRQTIRNHSRWHAAQRDVTVTARTSRTQSPDSTVVYLTLRSAFSISAESAQTSTSSLSASTWFPTSTNNWAPRLWKLPVFAPTSTWSRLQERKVSISVSALTHTMSSVSTRCCLAPVPIDCKLECVVLGESQTELLPVSTSVKSS